MPAPMLTARQIVTPKLRDLFYAEIANERYGGVSPSTLESSIDSLLQGAGIMDEGWQTRDWRALVHLLWILPQSTEVRELL